MTTYKIESRWPKWSVWKPVVARPHGEKYQYDNQTKELRFSSRKAAEQAKASFEKWNAGEYRIREVADDEHEFATFHVPFDL